MNESKEFLSKEPDNSLEENIAPDVERQPQLERQIEESVVHVSEVIDAAGEAHELTDKEFQRAQGLRAKLAECIKTFAEPFLNIPQEQRRFLLNADHAPMTEDEERFLNELMDRDPRFSFEISAGKEYHLEQIGRLLYELHRNEDYYRSHENTSWEVGSAIVRIPITDRVGVLGTFKEVGQKYAVYTRVRAREASALDPNAQDTKLQRGQRKRNTPRLLRAFSKMSAMSTDPNGDALEPIFGLPLPKSPEFKTRDQAEKFAEEQYALIQELPKLLFPGRITVMKKGENRSQTPDSRMITE